MSPTPVEWHWARCYSSIPVCRAMETWPALPVTTQCWAGLTDSQPLAGSTAKSSGAPHPPSNNAAFNSIKCGNGRKSSLEDQATGRSNQGRDGDDFEALFKWLNGNNGYKQAFGEAYPGEEISKVTSRRAIASFERTIVSNNSPFDRWLQGDANAMTTQQISGFGYSRVREGQLCHLPPGARISPTTVFTTSASPLLIKESPDIGRFCAKACGSPERAHSKPRACATSPKQRPTFTMVRPRI